MNNLVDIGHMVLCYAIFTLARTCDQIAVRIIMFALVFLIDFWLFRCISVRLWVLTILLTLEGEKVVICDYYLILLTAAMWVLDLLCERLLLICITGRFHVVNLTLRSWFNSLFYQLQVWIISEQVTDLVLQARVLYTELLTMSHILNAVQLIQLIIRKGEDKQRLGRIAPISCQVTNTMLQSIIVFEEIWTLFICAFVCIDQHWLWTLIFNQLAKVPRLLDRTQLHMLSIFVVRQRLWILVLLHINVICLCLPWDSLTSAQLLLQIPDFVMKLHDISVHLVEVLALIWSYGRHAVRLWVKVVHSVVLGQLSIQITDLRT